MHRRDDADGFAFAAEFPSLAAMFCGERSWGNSIRTWTSRSLTRLAAASSACGEVPVPGARRLMQQEPEAVLGALCGDVAADRAEPVEADALRRVLDPLHRALAHVAGAAEHPVDGGHRYVGRLGKIANGRACHFEPRVSFCFSAKWPNEMHETMLSFCIIFSCFDSGQGLYRLAMDRRQRPAIGGSVEGGRYPDMTRGT